MTPLKSWEGNSDRPRTAGEASRSGESTAAEGVYYAYAPRVYAIARRMLAHDADAEDVTQDVLVQIIRKLNTFRGEAGLGTWLHRVTVNAALDHRRKQARRRERQMGAPLDALRSHRIAGLTSCPHQSPDRRALDRELQGLIEQAIARLPEM